MQFGADFDTSVVKFEDHNVAYDPDTNSLKLGPVSRIKVDDNFVLAVSIHKWSVHVMPNKGNYIACLILKDTETAVSVLKNFQNVYENNNKVIEQIETGEYTDNIAVYRFSVNVWRPVKKKNTRWLYADAVKPSKDDPSYVQRLLKT